MKRHSHPTSLVLFAMLAFSGCRQQATETANAPSNTQSSPHEEASASPAAHDPEDRKPFQLEEGFQQLAFGDFEAFAAEPGTWTKTDEGLTCTGKPKGYLYSKQSHQNFTLRLDYRFTVSQSVKDESKFKGNTGFLIYITGEHKVWPMSMEVQGKHIQMASIKENGGAEPAKVKDDDAARQQSRRHVGFWNSLEVISKDGALSVQLNGTPISECEPNFLSEGLIGIQAEDHPFEVRRIRIRKD